MGCATYRPSRLVAPPMRERDGGAGRATVVPATPDRRGTGEVEQEREARLKPTRPGSLTPAGDDAIIEERLSKAMYTSL